jgi:hypothetical protein
VFSQQNSQFLVSPIHAMRLALAHDDDDDDDDFIPGTLLNIVQPF